MALTDPLAWIDLEMTGLDPASDVIVEIAVILTDGQLTKTIEGPELVIAASPDALARMAPIVRTMHTESGLLALIGDSTISVADAEQSVVDFLISNIGDGQDVLLAGNSVHTDRSFVHAHMPTLDEYLHYRHLDVSTLKEIARRWHPKALETAPRKSGGHRALADIRESIEELRHYRRTLFVEIAQEPQ